MRTSPSSYARELACLGGAILPGSDFSSPPALRGTALHKFLCGIGSGLGRDIALFSIPEEWREAAATIDLKALPPINPETGVPELALAWNIETGETRELDRGGKLSREEIRALARDGEMVGTIDWCALDAGAVHVRDWKTGWSTVDRAEVNSQIAVYAVMAAKHFKRDRAHVGITRLLSNGEAYHDVATLDALDLDEAEARIRGHARKVAAAEEAHRLHNVIPKLFEGSHCRWCPSFKFCGAKVALAKSILSEDGRPPSLFAALPVPLSEEDAAALWPKLQQAADLVEKLQRTVRELAQRTPLKLANGNLLAEVEVTTSTLIPERVKTFVEPAFYERIVSTKETITKESVKAMLKATKPEGKPLAPIEREFFAEAERLGALKVSTYRRVEEVKPTSKKLAAGAT